MILTTEIVIKITEANYSYYENLGYTVYLGDDIRIPVVLLSKGSQYKIECQCDDCGIVKTVIFKNYVKYNNVWGTYKCRKCSEFKRKNTLKENHKVEYPIQSKTIRKKMEKTMMKKYRVKNASQIKKSG